MKVFGMHSAWWFWHWHLALPVPSHATGEAIVLGWFLVIREVNDSVTCFCDHFFEEIAVHMWLWRGILRSDPCHSYTDEMRICNILNKFGSKCFEKSSVSKKIDVFCYKRRVPQYFVIPLVSLNSFEWMQNMNFDSALLNCF